MRRQGECPICPPLVTHCAHLDGRVIQLRKFRTSGQYQVCGPAAVGIVNGKPGFHTGRDCNRVAFLILPAAEVEFERRAEELRLAPVEA